MKPIEAVEKEIIKEFDQYPDIESKYTHLFKIGYDLPKMDPAVKNEENLVKGCQSQLWFYLNMSDGKLSLQVDSDSMVMKGIGALLVRLVEGRHPEEIKDLSLDFIDRLNLWKLASNRNNGLLAMMSHLRNQAEKLSGED
jgi:cysteine desulfuration protein SufE